MWFVQMNPSIGCWVCFIICMMVNSSFLRCQAATIILGAITLPSVSACLTALIWYKWPLAVLSLVCAASVSPQLEVYDDSGKTWRENCPSHNKKSESMKRGFDVITSSDVIILTKGKEEKLIEGTKGVWDKSCNTPQTRVKKTHTNIQIDLHR